MLAVEKSLDTQILQNYTEYENMFFHITKHMNISREDTKSIAYEAIWRSLQTYDEDKMKFSSYLYLVFTRLCVKADQSEKRRLRIKTSQIHDGLMSPKVNKSIEDTVDMGPLSMRERGVISDYFQDSMTLAEIGEKNRITAERVRQIKNKALEKLKCAMS